MDPSRDALEEQRTAAVMRCLTETLDRAGVAYTVDDSDPLSPDLVFLGDKRLVVDSVEVLFGYGHSQLRRDDQCDVLWLPRPLDLDRVSTWLLDRLNERCGIR